MDSIGKTYPPSKFIKDELEKRNWTQTDLAFILGRNTNDISLLVSGRKRITPAVAQELASALGNSAEYWLNLEANYNLAQLDSIDDSVARRARLFTMLPAKEILKRGWIEPSDDINELEKRFLDFFGIDSLDEKPQVSYAARKSGSYAETSMTQTGWLKRAYQLAPAVMVSKFSDEALEKALEKLHSLLFNVEEIRHIPKILADAGIRLLIIEPLPQTKIDGVTFWIDKQSPVIVLSLRFDRIDGLWHTLIHELDHVKNREGQDEPIIDTNLIGEESPKEDKPENEKRAELFASEFSIPSGKLDHFILRVNPSFTEEKILGFSARWKVHAGIVVGQLQHRGKIPYSYHRKYLVKVKDILTSSALTDGWGNRPLI